MYYEELSIIMFIIKSAINTILILILEFTQNLQLKYNITYSKSKLCECQNIFLLHRVYSLF